MATQAEREARVAALEAARASGVSRVTYEGRTIEYRSMAELEHALTAERHALSQLRGTTIVRHIRVYQDGKGL